MDHYPFQFEGPIVYHDVGSETYAYTVVFLPRDMQADLPLKEYPRLRVEGEIGEHPFQASLTPVRGDWYILISKKTLKTVGAIVGDDVEVRFRIADQDAVDIPLALRQALADDDEARALWQDQTAGKQRGLAYRVASAKAAETQAKRVEEVFDILRGDLDMRGKPIR